MPVTPHIAAGWRTEPPVSVPVASGTSPAATAAAEPPDEPPAIRAASHGLRTAPKTGFSLADPMANSSQLSLAEADGAGRGHALDHGRVERADVVGQHPRAGGRPPATGDEDVLVGYRHAEQRRRPPSAPARAIVGQPLVGLPAPAPGQLGLDVEEGIEAAGRGAARHRRPSRAPNTVARAGRSRSSSAERSDVRSLTWDLAPHSTTRGTRYSPSATAGASAGSPRAGRIR